MIKSGNIFFRVLLLISFFSLLACQRKQVTFSIDKKLFCREWVLLNDEIRIDGDVLKPVVGDVFALHDQVRWVFKPDGKLFYLPLSTQDKPLTVKGKWAMVGKETIVLDFEPNTAFAAKHYRKIISLQADRLVWSNPYE